MWLPYSPTHLKYAEDYMPTALYFLNIWKDGFDNKDSSRCGEFMTDDWEYIFPHRRN